MCAPAKKYVVVKGIGLGCFLSSCQVIQRCLLSAYALFSYGFAVNLEGLIQYYYPFFLAQLLFGFTNPYWSIAKQAKEKPGAKTIQISNLGSGGLSRASCICLL